MYATETELANTKTNKSVVRDSAAKINYFLTLRKLLYNCCKARAKEVLLASLCLFAHKSIRKEVS